MGQQGQDCKSCDPFLKFHNFVYGKEPLGFDGLSKKCVVKPAVKSSGSSVKPTQLDDQPEVSDALDSVDWGDGELTDPRIRKSFDAYMVLTEDRTRGQHRLRETDNRLYLPS